MGGVMMDPPSGTAHDDARSRSRPDLLWYLRHADALARWPVLAEPWAQRVERRRLEAPATGAPREPGSRAYR